MYLEGIFKLAIDTASNCFALTHWNSHQTSNPVKTPDLFLKSRKPPQTSPGWFSQPTAVPLDTANRLFVLHPVLLGALLLWPQQKGCALQIFLFLLPGFLVQLG